ncbi:nucleotidyltransferase family protein [Lachnospiraceae bacterium C1.1]|nr:nucleotidyltransferase family protein [Lachnospiraceae bacterium C1.1]
MEKGNLALIRQYIEILSLSLNDREIRESYSDCDWNLMRILSTRNKCGVLFNNTVNKYASELKIDSKVLEDWNKRSKQEFVVSYNAFTEFKRVMTAMNEKGIRSIVLKGYSLALLYPNIFFRYSCDLDIKVEPEDKDKVHEMFTNELGFSWNEADSKGNVYLYYNNNLLVEVHFTLWEDYHGKNIEVLKAEELDRPDTLEKVEITPDISITTLGFTEHLILQMFHIIKHYIVEAIESRYFCDIALFVNKYADEIDFKRFYSVMQKMDFEKFCVIYFSECIRYFGMTDKALDGREMLLPEDEMGFFRDIIYLGKEDLNDKAEFSLLGILSPYVNGREDKTAESRGMRIMQSLFPSSKNIDDHYSYCKKYPVLLPVGWTHRAFRTIYFKLTKGSKVYGVGDKLKKSEYRISMMKNVGIIDKE